MENKIVVKRTGLERIYIQREDIDKDGNIIIVDSDDYIEFDLESIELPIRLQESDELHKKNVREIQNKYIIISKKQDKKGKKLLSSNQEEKIRALSDFYLKEEKALDLFLGEGSTKKILNGREPYYSMYDDITEMLEPILPQLKKGFENIEKKIKDKYSKKEENVIE